jgi:methyltransferase-like protein/SAM-dependent methyltransferase
MSTQLTAYDRVPYPSVAFAQTHPDNLATIAMIFGLSPADTAASRVLELGCASGGNLIPMAFNLPRSEFVGVDLSRRQVEEAHAAIRGLGLPNIRVEHCSIEEIDRGWGEFDYIICHGVFSWVPDAVQDKILQISHDNLRHNGIAYISYNTYPGWHMRETVRDMMRYHVDQFDDPQEQVRQARALLAFLTSAADASSAYGQLLNGEVDRLGRATDSYLYHEHLEQTNAPLYFHQFVDRAERAGLLYLGEATISEMLTTHFSADVAETLERISPDILHLEQYMDFVRNRQFRQTLLCHDDAGPRRSLTPDVLDGVMVSTPAVAETWPLDLTYGTKAVFWRGKQRAEAALPASKAAFGILMEQWPAAIAVTELCSAALERARPFLAGASEEEARRGLLGDLFGGVMYGMVRVHTRQPPCTNAPSATPKAHPLAAYQAAQGTIVVSAHHDSVQLQPLEHAVLQRCDGVRQRDDIVREVLAQFERTGSSIDGADALKSEECTPEAVHGIFDRLTRHGLLVQ